MTDMGKAFILLMLGFVVWLKKATKARGSALTHQVDYMLFAFSVFFPAFLKTHFNQILFNRSCMSNTISTDTRQIHLVHTGKRVLPEWLISGGY